MKRMSILDLLSRRIIPLSQTRSNLIIVKRIARFIDFAYQVKHLFI